MRLDAASHLPRLILQAPHRSVKGVTHGDIDILMRMIDGLRPIDHHVLSRHADVETNIIQLALVVVPVRRLHHDSTADDAVVEALKLLRLLADALLDGGRGVPEADLQPYWHWRDHSAFSFNGGAPKRRGSLRR
jgi:hypothetical protein